MQNYLLDACALIAFSDEEDGVIVVKELLHRAERREIAISIHAANLIEVYYDRIRAIGSDAADTLIHGIYDVFPITVINTFSPAIVREAAYFKADGKMSFADAILVATARRTGATIVTCDHAELEPVEQRGLVSFLWIRPKR
jgi:uncharacterized protein